MVFGGVSGRRFLASAAAALGHGQRFRAAGRVRQTKLVESMVETIHVCTGWSHNVSCDGGISLWSSMLKSSNPSFSGTGWTQRVASARPIVHAHNHAALVSEG